MRLAVGRGLGGAGEGVAEADRHDVEGLARRQHRAVAGGGMVGMGVGDQRARHRAHRVDVEVAGRAVEALGAGDEEVGGAHAEGLGRAGGSSKGGVGRGAPQRRGLAAAGGSCRHKVRAGARRFLVVLRLWAQNDCSPG